MKEIQIDPVTLLAAFGDGIYTSINNKNEQKVEICNKPKSWQDLQELVFKLFNQLGYVAHIEKKIPHVRGTAEIDVYAEKRQTSYNHEKIMVECKNWNSNIPQSVVHSVRTVAEDIGANKAYIIVKQGFQRGAIEAAENTVVKLFTLDDFLDSIADEWLIQLKKDYYEKLHQLKKYLFLNEMLCWEVGTDKGFESNEHRNKYINITNKYLFSILSPKILGTRH